MKSSAEVCAIAGIPYSQLDCMIRSGYIPLADPLPGSGHPRQFDEASVEAVVRIAEARRHLKAVLS